MGRPRTDVNISATWKVDVGQMWWIRGKAYLVVGQQFGACEDDICIEALLYQKRLSDEVGNVIRSNEPNLSILRSADDLVIGPDAMGVERQGILYEKRMSV